MLPTVVLVLQAVRTVGPVGVSKFVATELAAYSREKKVSLQQNLWR